MSNFEKLSQIEDNVIIKKYKSIEMILDTLVPATTTSHGLVELTSSVVDNADVVPTSKAVFSHINTKLLSYLPLTGGTMTGEIVFDNTDYSQIHGIDDTCAIGIRSGTNFEEGASIYLGGKNHARENGAYQGVFHISAYKSADENAVLEGHPNGRLYWPGYMLFRGVPFNSKPEDISIGMNINTNELRIIGGKNCDEGGGLYLYNINTVQDNGDYCKGGFQLVTNPSKSTDKREYLLGTSDNGGLLSWSGTFRVRSKTMGVKDLQPSICGEDSTKELAILSSDYTYTDPTTGEKQFGGAQLYLHGVNGTHMDMGSGLVPDMDSGAGAFLLVANNGNKNYYLTGNPNTGALIWDGYMQVNGFNSENGQGQNVVIGKQVELCKLTNDSGFEICGGTSYWNGGFITILGNQAAEPGVIKIIPAISETNASWFVATPNGSLSWSGQPLQVTSDERKKTEVKEISDDVLDAWKDVNWTSFKYKDDVDRKGSENTRKHTGLIAQQIISAFKAHKLDACDYGLICYDKEQDLWSVRYDEALAMETIYQRRENEKLKEEIKELKELILSMKK